MKDNALSIEEFKRFIPRVKCINLFHYNLFNSPKLSEVCTVTASKLESADELERLSDTALVWYVNNDGVRIMWDSPGAINIVLASLARQYASEPSEMDTKLAETVESIRQGLKKNIELICVYDTTLGANVLVDGVYRGLALYYLFITEPETIENLMESAFSIQIVTLNSPAASMLFPCDFINICRARKQPQ
jgi:hypothetical protein